MFGRGEPGEQGRFVENQGAPRRGRRLAAESLDRLAAHRANGFALCPVSAFAGSSMPVMDVEKAAGHYLLRVFII